MASSFSIVNKTRGKTPRIPFAEIKNAMLGRDYELSLALLTPAEARRITRKYKYKSRRPKGVGIPTKASGDKPSNVLSFPLGKKSGEILICPATARAQAPQYGYSYRTFMARLFIHGNAHLAGYTHGARMEHEEDRIARRFGF